VGIADATGPNYVDRDDDTPIIYSRRVSLDTNGDKKEDETLTLSLLYAARKEMFHQIRNGDGQDRNIFDRVFPEDVE
jgi:hypothetical protein